MSAADFQQKIKDRAIRLFTYLQELVQLRTPQVRDIENYEAVVWFFEVPHEEECYSISWGAPLEDSDVWLEIRKRKEPVCPALPAICRGWIDPRAVLKSEAEPQLADRIFIPEIQEDEQNPSSREVSSETANSRWVLLSERHDISEAWNTYLAERWRPWSEKHRRWSTNLSD